MTSPLAAVFYENLFPGSQLVNKLQDLGYRVHVSNELAAFGGQVEAQKPLIVLIDLTTTTGDACKTIYELRGNPATTHIPIIAFAGASNKNLQTDAQTAGANIVARDDAILAQLPQLLDRALQVD